jgi:16S rRNA (guanine(966)-N(2))-methyltransferase RsmD
MRVISGLYRGRVLKSPPDRKTRPTSDRLRETIFNILTPIITEETRFLDLCAGTGAIGIEAISRGVGFVTFVDRSRRACALIEENLDLLNIPEEETEVINLEAQTFTGREHEKGWDIIFFDPPYDSDYAMLLFDFRQPGENLMRDGGRLIVEHHSKNTLPDSLGDLRRWRILKQGETCLSFYERS